MFVWKSNKAFKLLQTSELYNLMTIICTISQIVIITCVLLCRLLQIRTFVMHHTSFLMVPWLSLARSPQLLTLHLLWGKTRQFGLQVSIICQRTLYCQAYPNPPLPTSNLHCGMTNSLGSVWGREQHYKWKLENYLICLSRCCTELCVEKPSCKLGINFLPGENEIFALFWTKSSRN